MDKNVIKNFLKLKPTLYILPILLLAIIVLCLGSQHALNLDGYIQIQKSTFLFLNAKISQYPDTAYNLTQFGDALVFLSFLAIFIVYAPKVWESLIFASLVSAVFSRVLKQLFSVPRPAAVFDKDSFVIIGKAVYGSNSLPSGHSITVFTTITVLMFAFMPEKLSYKIAWYLLLLGTGMFLAFTRVGVGAHYPLDVITGSIIGYISGVTGIFIGRKYKILNWICDKKYYPVVILLFLLCCLEVIHNIAAEHLIVFYFLLASLLVSLFKIISVYVKK